MADLMQQAREFLAVAHENAGDPLSAEAVRKGWSPVPTVELEAIAAALRAAPEVTPEMVAAAEEAYMPFGDMELALNCALAARPQGVKDAR